MPSLYRNRMILLVVTFFYQNTKQKLLVLVRLFSTTSDMASIRVINSHVLMSTEYSNDEVFSE